MESRFDTLPSRLRACAIEHEIDGVPCLLIRQDEKPRPFLFWMHGRTADKELDPGRYLRYIRHGINICAVDLPGHGARFEEGMHEARRAFDVVTQMVSEIDGVIQGLRALGGFDLERAAIGGMSAGGMAAVLYLLGEHQCKAVVLEATMSSWNNQQEHPMFSSLTHEEFEKQNPMNNIAAWQPIPLLAFHSMHDEWVPYVAQEKFIEAIQSRYQDKRLVELISFDYTGAPYEHMGFGRQSSVVKEEQVKFIVNHLQVHQEASA